jgi:hypothetical protein
MSKDHLERKTYRKSPGRQYGYEYDPLHSHSGQSQSGGSQQGESASRSGTLLAQRPDPRRTRQLMRQSIIASKRPNEEDTEPIDLLEEPRYVTPARRYTPRTGLVEEEYLPPVPGNRRSAVQPARATRIDQPALPSNRALLLPEEDEYLDDPYEAQDWREQVADPEMTLADPRASRQPYDDEYDEYPEDFIPRPATARASQSLRGKQAKPTRRLEPEPEPMRDYPAEEDDYEYEYEYEEDRDSVPRRKKKHKLTRRGLLLGAGVAAVAGIGVAAYEVAPKLPKTINDVGTNVEHQIQDAFNKGLQQGADEARKEFVTALDNLEGFSLDGAIAAARLTRVAYDVFVSPVVKFGATLTGDFLNGMLKAFKTAREWLAGVYQDNASLIAIQKVLEAWVDQVSNMPKQLDAITQTDLDGAQAYLRALQRKIEDEKNKLNKPQNQQATPSATPKAQVTPSQQQTK